MKNYVLYLIKSKIDIRVKGNNIERFIKRLKSNHIEILNIKYINKCEIIIRIYKDDYENIEKIKTIYEISILNYFGLTKLKSNLSNNKFIIIFILIALVSLNILTSLIFDIEIVTNDSNMKKILINELEDYGVKKYKFKKSYVDLQRLKNEILNKYKDKIDWIEIENIGTKYIVRYEPRIENIIEEKTPFRNIVAKKDALIIDMDISDGQIIKNKNMYVKKGDVIVSGYIKLNDQIKDTVSAKGEVYGEVWYNVEVTYPYKYYENIETGNKKNVFVIKFLNKEIELFNFKKYTTKNVINNIILKNNLLPISFIYQNQKETNEKVENNTEDEAIKKAIDIANKKINDKLNNDEYIKDYKILNKTTNKDSVTLNIFYTVVLNITSYEQIDEYESLEE